MQTKKKSSQWLLYKILQEIFPPGVVILEEIHLPSALVIQTGYLMTFDIFVPSMNMIFEYHGYHHYYDHHMFGDVISRKERDEQRRLVCSYHNVIYLEVPYWWHCDKASVIALIHQKRPDIVPHAVDTPFQYRIATELTKDVNIIKYV